MSASLGPRAPVHCRPNGSKFSARKCHQRGFFLKIEATLALHATGLPVLGHLGIAFRRTMLGLGYPGLGHRIEELFVTSHLMIWHLEFAIGPPTLSNRHQVFEALLKLPQLAHASLT